MTNRCNRGDEVTSNKYPLRWCVLWWYSRAVVSEVRNVLPVCSRSKVRASWRKQRCRTSGGFWGREFSVSALRGGVGTKSRALGGKRDLPARSPSTAACLHLWDDHVHQVTQEMLPFTRECFANPAGKHVYGRVCKSAVDEARDRVAALLDCQPDEIVFVSTGSEANNHAILAAVR